MFRYLFILFLIVPLIEVWILVNIGQQIGALSLIGLVVLTALIGVQLLRIQGPATLFRAQEAMARGQLPALELAEGVMLLLAGAFLLTPGFATDTLGFVLLWPAARKVIAAQSIGLMARHSKYSFHQSETFSSNGEDFQQFQEWHMRTSKGERTGQGKETIDAEYTREEKNSDKLIK